MPRPALRSRKLRRISKKTPGGQRVVHYGKRFASKPKCAICGRPLNGINETRIKTEHVPGSTISRPYGSYICHRCLALALRTAVRLS